MTAPAASAGVRTLTAPRRIVAIGMLSAALLMCGATLAESAAPTHEVVWGSLALAAFAAGLLCMVGAGNDVGFGLARWKFGPWILLWYGLAFGLATLTWAGQQTLTAAQISLSSVLRALCMVTVGLACWATGYFVGPGQPLRHLADRGLQRLSGHVTDSVRSGFTPWILYAAGTAGRLASTATTGRFGYVGDASSAVSTATGYGQLLSALSLLAPLAVSAAALQVYRERRPGARITLVILLLAELAFGAAAGGKESFVIAVLAVVIPMSAAHHRLPKAAVIGGVLIFLAVVIPFNQAYRAAARGGSASLSPSQAIDEAPAILRQTLRGSSQATVLPNSTLYLLQRIREIDSPAIVLQRTPSQIAFSSPAQLVEAPLADVVPRAVWAGKPILDTGYLFSQQYYGISSTLYTSSAITPLGDLYRHGGWVPVIAGMFLLGCGVRLLDDALDVGTNPHAIFLVLLLFPSLVKGEQDWVTLLASMPTTGLVWLLAVALAFRPRKLT